MKLRKILGNKKSELLEKEQQRSDIGFGTTLTDASSRLVNKDGSFNVKRINVSFEAWFDVLHRLTVMSWSKFITLVFLIYFIVNCLFSVIYICIGTTHLQGVKGVTAIERFWETFFFSAQTLTTVGYGHIAPMGVLTSAVSSVEALVGLLGFALATGLMYGRFSRPKSMILFSNNALISPYLDINAFMFRMINQSRNELTEVTVEMTLSRLETLPDGKTTRKYYGLELERKYVAFFSSSWTLVHPITEKSPLNGVSEDDLAQSDAEFLIYVRAIEDTFLQPIHARCSYRFTELVWGAKFRPFANTAAPTSKMLVIDTQEIHLFSEATLN
jgi:inward rectifier potassium channel